MQTQRGRARSRGRDGRGWGLAVCSSALHLGQCWAYSWPVFCWPGALPSIPLSSLPLLSVHEGPGTGDPGTAPALPGANILCQVALFSRAWCVYVLHRQVIMAYMWSALIFSRPYSKIITCLVSFIPSTLLEAGTVVTPILQMRKQAQRGHAISLGSRS